MYQDQDNEGGVRQLASVSRFFSKLWVLCGWLILPALPIQAEFTPDANDVWKVGLAAVRITPTEPVLLSGYGGRENPYQGIDNDLYAKCLAIEDQYQHVAVLITLDVECMRDHTVKPLIERLCDKTGLKPGQFLLNFSHTHAAPFLTLDPQTTDYGSTPETAEKSVAHTQWLIEQIVGVACAALSERKPAKLSYAVGVAPFVMSRREWTADEVRLGVNPRGYVDRSVPVLRVDDLEGNPRAVVFGCACHNTTLTGENFLVSGDYAGYAQLYLEQRFPEVQAMFMTGCGGDANPYPRGTLELARVHGRVLGQEVSRFLHPASADSDAAAENHAERTRVRGPLMALHQEIELPLRQLQSMEKVRQEAGGTDRWKAYHAQKLLRMADAGQRAPEAYPCPLAVWQFGKDLTLVGLSGEIVAGYVPLLERQLGADGLWVAAYCNEQFGYVPTKQMILEGGYETRGLEDGKVGQFAESVEQVLVTQVTRLVRRARRELSDDLYSIGQLYPGGPVRGTRLAKAK